MFSAKLQVDAFQELMSGQVTEVFYSPPGDSCQDERVGFETRVLRLPMEGTQWMILNNQKMLIQVSWDESDPDECPCCAWYAVWFKLVG